MLEMDQCLKNALLAAHNNVRSKMARDIDDRYETAANMNELVWDQTLANLCLQNVRQCDMKHDICRPGNETKSKRSQ